MNLMGKAEFLNWTKEKNIHTHVGTGFYSLSLTNNKSLRRFWVTSDIEYAGGLTIFFIEVLKNVDDWKKCYVFKKEGRWGTFGPSGGVWAILLQKLGIPENFEGSVEYEKSELLELASLLFIQTSFAWSGGDEFYVVFDNAQQIIFIDEDHNLCMEFASQSKLDEFVPRIKQQSYPEEKRGEMSKGEFV